jgi:aspartyl-tRNA(Asn)/glutamyl-tRNA(Gln) amidotransferase subunit A
MVAAFARRELSPVEVLPSGDDPFGAFTAWCLDRARAEARTAEAAWARGEPTGPLCGVPFAAKDILDTAGVATECGSAILSGRVPVEDAAAVARIRAAGGILVGKTATVEFAWGLMMRTTRNPYDPERTPGGSSGGSAVAVATGTVPLALGTDTGGSIRLPAGFCGIVGHKTGPVSIPKDGCWPLARSLDSIGPLTSTVADAELLFGVLAEPWVRRAGLAAPMAGGAMAVPGLRLGVPRDLGLPLAPAVQSALSATIERLRSAGAEVVDVDIPSPDEVMTAFSPGFMLEALSAHITAGLWPSRRGEYTDSVRRRLELAEAQSAEAFVAGMEASGRVHDAYAELWQQIDVLLTPVCAVGPPRIDDAHADLRDVASPFLAPQNLLGIPATSVPAGRDEDGMPIGVQVTGPSGQDQRVLAVAAAAIAPA